MKFKRGDVVRCVRDERDVADYGVIAGKEYVVNAVERHHHSDYLVILGDNDRGHPLLNSMFEPSK